MGVWMQKKREVAAVVVLPNLAAGAAVAEIGFDGLEIRVRRFCFDREKRNCRRDNRTENGTSGDGVEGNLGRRKPYCKWRSGMNGRRSERWRKARRR